MSALSLLSDMNQMAVRAAVGAGAILAALAVHLQVISPAAALSAVLLVVVTSGTTAAVVASVVSERDAQLTEIRQMLARIREDQVRAKKQSEALIVDETDE
jgi:urease accessory protein UreF